MKYGDYTTLEKNMLKDGYTEANPATIDRYGVSSVFLNHFLTLEHVVKIFVKDHPDEGYVTVFILGLYNETGFTYKALVSKSMFINAAVPHTAIANLLHYNMVDGLSLENDRSSETTPN